MAAGITASQGWTILSQLASKVGANGTVSSSDVEELMKKADRNKDGKVTSDEFVFCYKTTDDYQEMEDKYNNAFKVVAAFDQDANSISQEDILGIIESIKSLDIDELDLPTDANVGGGGGAGGGTGGGGLGSGEFELNLEPATPETQAVSFSGEETVEELQAGRNETLDTIDKFNQEKSNIEQQPAVQQAQANVNRTQDAYNKSLDALEQKEGEKTELEQNILDQKELKDQNDQAISKQQESIAQIKASIESVNEKISSTESSISSHMGAKPQRNDFLKSEPYSYTDPKTGEEVHGEREVFDGQAYSAAMSSWNAQLSQLKQTLNDAKAEKTKLTTEQRNAEQELEALKAKEISIDTAINDLIADAKEKDVEISKEVQNVQTNLQSHQMADLNLLQVEHDTMAQIDAELAVLHQNLSAYANQISEVKTNERVNNIEELSKSPTKLEKIFDDPEISASEELYILQLACATNPSVVEEFLENNKEFLTGTVEELASDYGISVDDMYEIALANAKTDIDQKMQKVDNMRTGLGNQVTDFFASLFGGGASKEFSKVFDAKQLYAEAEVNPTPENINAVLNALDGIGMVDWNAAAQQVKMAEYLSKGITGPDGQPIDMQTINKMLEDGLTNLEATFKETTESAGVISMLAGMAADIGGIGTTSTMTKEEINRLRDVITKMGQTTDPLEYAALYKQATGQELTYGGITNVMSSENVGILDVSPAAESIMDYESNRESVKAGGVALVVGALTGGMGILPAIGLSALGYAGANLIDAATKNNGKSGFENVGEYLGSGEVLKDLAVGAVNGVSNKIGNFAGKALSTISGTAGSGVVRQLGQIAGNAVDGYLDGAISAGAEYSIDALTSKEDKNGDGQIDNQFNVDDLVASMKSGGMTGALMNTAIGGLKGEYKLDNLPQLDAGVLKNLGINGAADALNLKPGETFKVLQDGKSVDYVAEIDGKSYNIRNENGKVQFVPTDSKGLEIASSQLDANNAKIDQNNKLISDEQGVAPYEGQEVGLAYLEGQNDALTDVNSKLNDGSLRTADDIKSQIEANNQKIADNNKLIADEQGVASYEGQEVGLAYLEGQNDALAEVNKGLEAELNKIDTDAKVDADAKAKVDTEQKANAEQKADTETKTDVEPKVDAEPKGLPAADSNLKLDAEPKVDADAKAKVDTEQKANAEPKVEPDTGVKSNAGSESPVKNSPAVDPSKGTIFVIDGKKVSNLDGKNYIEVDGVWKEVPDLKLTVEQLSKLKKMSDYTDSINLENYNNAVSKYSNPVQILNEFEKVYKQLRYANYSISETFGSLDARNKFFEYSIESDNGVVVLPFQEALDHKYNWVARHNPDMDPGAINVIDRFSLNVEGNITLIKELDEFMRTGEYTTKSGKRVKVDIQNNGGDFYYKVPNRIDEWTKRQDPITVYCNGNASPELEKALTEISAKYQRGSLNVADPDSETPWIQKEHSPSHNEVQQFVMNAYDKYGEKVGQALLGYLRSDGINYSASSGMMRAVQEVLASIDNLNNIGRNIQTSLNYRKMFNDATLNQVDIDSSSTIKSTSSIGADSQVKSDAQVKFENEKASYEAFKAKYEKALADVQEFEDLVKSGASADVIKKKFRELSMLYHPDSRQGNIGLTDEQNALFGNGVFARISSINDVAKGKGDFSKQTFKNPIINKEIDKYFSQQDAKFYASNDVDVNDATKGANANNGTPDVNANKTPNGTNANESTNNANANKGPEHTNANNDTNANNEANSNKGGNESNATAGTTDTNVNNGTNANATNTSKVKAAIQKLKDMINQDADPSQINNLYTKIQDYCKMASLLELSDEARDVLKYAAALKTIGGLATLAFSPEDDNKEPVRPEDILNLEQNVEPNFIKFDPQNGTPTNGNNGVNGAGAGTPARAAQPQENPNVDNNFPGIGKIDFSQPVDYENLLSNENLIFQTSQNYTTLIDENLQEVLEKSLNPDVQIIEEEPLIFHSSESNNVEVADISDEYALNVIGSSALIQELEQLMTTGTYNVEINGELQTIDVDDMTKFMFSTVNDASKWNDTDAPVTLYFEGDINDETLTAIEFIASKYARGEFPAGNGVDNDVPYMKKYENPTDAQMEELHLKATDIDENFANSVLEQSRNLVGVSGLQYAAALEIIEQFEQDILNSI